MGALREAFGAAIETIERDSVLSITGHAEPEWAASDRLPAAAKAARGRLLLAEQRREARRTAASRRRKLPEQAGPTWTLDRIDQARGWSYIDSSVGSTAAGATYGGGLGLQAGRSSMQPHCSRAHRPAADGCTCCRTSCRWTSCTTTTPWAAA